MTQQERAATIENQEMIDRSILSRANMRGQDMSSILESSKAAFSVRRSTLQAENGVTNPIMLRGSLNSNYRKSEMNRINLANAVSNRTIK